MPTVVTKSIGSAGGRDYSTLQAWEDAAPANLVSSDQVWKGECYNDSEFTAACAISGTTTDATRYVWLTVAAGNSFIDDSGVLTNALKYDQSKGVGINYFGAAVSITTNNVLVERLQTTGTPGLGIKQTSSSTGVTVKNCLFLSSDASTGTGALTLYGGTAVNVLAINTNGGAVCVSSGGNSVFRNVTAVQTNGGTSRGFRNNYDSPLYYNCASFGSGTPYQGASGASNYNASDKASAPGANSVSSLTFADQFQGITKAAQDWRVKAGNGLGVGVRDATNTNDLDLVGQTRSTSTPTIGAWEYISGGGGPATVIPIGVSATASVGTPTATGSAKALPSGVNASSSVGTPIATGGTSVPATATPSGVSASTAVGTPTATGQAKALPIGVSATASVGTPAAIAGSNIPATALPAGVSVTSAVGAPIAKGQAVAKPVGVSVTSAVGTPVAVAGASGAATAYPVGVVAYSSVGALVATGAAWVIPIGVSAASAVGTPIAISGNVPIYVDAPSGGGYQGRNAMTSRPIQTNAARPQQVNTVR